MPTLTEFLQTDLAKAAIVRGTIDGWIAKAEGKGAEVEEEYRLQCQKEANRRRKNIDLYAYTATQQSIAFLLALTS